MKRKIFCILFVLVLVLSFSLITAAPAAATAATYYVSILTGDDASTTGNATAPWRSIKHAISQASDGDTIMVVAGTYTVTANETFPIDISEALTIQSVSGNATTIIEPGANGQGAIKISHNDVTLIGFTVKQGTQARSAAHPAEHTVWVAAEYSTIENNTIIGAGGNTACLFIGDRIAKTDGTAQWWYNVSKPLGHIIQDNAFRYGTATTGSGEGWGIFAVDLTDSLIHGNTFVGEAGVSDAAGDDDWNTSEGAPGTCIVIHKATFATASGSTGSPGGGYVLIEDNTAEYIKYAWLNFPASFMYADVDGVAYEKAEAGTIDGVIVKNNTASNIGKDSSAYDGVAVNFKAEKKDYPSGTPLGASLTIGANLVTIGPGNSFHDVGTGVNIDDPKYVATYYGVLNAANIVIKYNDIYDAESYGVYNGMYYDGLAAAMTDTLGTVTIPALYNYWGDASGANVTTATASPVIHVNDRGAGDALSTYVTYEPWLTTTQATVYPSGIRYYGYNWCSLTQGWNVWSTPIALDAQCDTWGEYKALGTDLALASGIQRLLLYRQAEPGLSVTIATYSTPCDAIYINMASAQTSPILFSPSYSAPSKTLYAGWNLVSASYINSMDSPTITTGTDPEDAL